MRRVWILLLAWFLSTLSTGTVRAAPPSAATDGPSSVRVKTGVVVADHGLASRAGVEIMRMGGNAVDSAVAAALAVGVVNPSSCGIGGGGFMIIFDRDAGEVHALDYRESAPRAAHRDLFVREGEVVAGLSTVGGLAVATPGELAGIAAALQRFGTMSLEAVAAPAVRLARQGFAVEAHLASAIERRLEVIRAHDELARIFLHADGTPLRRGEILRQPDLARTLQEASRDGGESFYRGRVGQAIVDAVSASGGVMSTRDLAEYRPRWRRPVHAGFRGKEVFSMPPPSSGGGVLIEILNTVAGDDLAALGHNSPTYMHLMAEAMKFAFADRAAWYGDPDYVSVPLERLISRAAGRRKRRSSSAVRTHDTEFYGRVFAGDDAGTSHLSVVDPAGNAVALTTSVNTGFGSKVVVPGTGIILNNTMDDFSARPGEPNTYGLVGSEANSIEPGKRPLSSMTPTIVLENGRVVAVAGASGGPLIITSTLQALLNVIVFDFDAAAAVAAPRLHHQWVPPVLMLENGIRSIDDFPLVRLGHRLFRSNRSGAVQLIRRTREGWLEGAADPRKGGRAAGW